MILSLVKDITKIFSSKTRIFTTFLVILAFSISASSLEVTPTSVVFHADWQQPTSQFQQSIQKYHSHLANNKLESISLSFAYCSDPKSILTQIFTSPLHASSISINLNNCKLKDQGITHIISLINPQIVTSLSLNLDATGISSIITKNLGEIINKMPLENLSLSFMLCRLGDQAINHLMSSPLPQSLKSLKIDLTANQLTHKGLSHLPLFLKNIPFNQLKNISLLLGNNKIEEQGAVHVANSLAAFTTLERIKLDFYFGHLGAKGARHIAQIIKQQTQIKELSANFDLNYIETQGAEAIGQALSRLNSLTTLQIGVASKNFGLKGFLAILKGIQQMIQLRRLTLRCGVNRVKIQGAQATANLLTKLTKLQYLDLNFVENSVYDDGVVILSKAIQTLSGLTELKLNLGFNQAKGNAIKELIKMLFKKHLTSLQLTLSNNPIQDTTVKQILPYLESIAMRTQKFQLELLQTKITPTGVYQLQSLFNKIMLQGKSQAHVFVNSQQQNQKIRDQLQAINAPQNLQL